MIRFDKEFYGAQKQLAYPSLRLKYTSCTQIEKCLLSYSLMKNSSVVGSTAQVYQFPVVVCFATTIHKFQGGTVAKANTVAEDLRTVFENAAGYVMLSRVQALSHLFIIDSIPLEKIWASKKCLAEGWNVYMRRKIHQYGNKIYHNVQKYHV